MLRIVRSIIIKIFIKSEKAKKTYFHDYYKWNHTLTVLILEP